MAFQLDTSIYDKQRSVSDYMRENEAYNLNKQAKQQQMEAGDFEMKQKKIQGALQLLDMAIDEPSYQQARQQAQAMGFDTSALPQQYDPMWVENNKRLLRSEMDKSLPASVREYDFYRNLNADEQRNYLQVKRANPYINLGDRMTQVDPVTGATTNELPINPKVTDTPDYKAQVEAAKLEAEQRAKAKANLPVAESNANQVLTVLDQIKKHPGKQEVVGAKNAMSGAVTSYIPLYPKDEITGIKKPVAGTDAAGFNELLRQSKGQQFLQAFESLKGGGHITEIEGVKATQAISRMSAAQSEEEFDAAVDELIGIVQRGLESARRSAGASSAQPDAQEQQPQSDPRVQKALEAGYSMEEIQQFLGGQ